MLLSVGGSLYLIILSRIESDQQHLVDSLGTSSTHHVQTAGGHTPHLSPPPLIQRRTYISVLHYRQKLEVQIQI